MLAVGFYSTPRSASRQPTSIATLFNIIDGTKFIPFAHPTMSLYSLVRRSYCFFSGSGFFSPGLYQDANRFAAS